MLGEEGEGRCRWYRVPVVGTGARWWLDFSPMRQIKLGSCWLQLRESVPSFFVHLCISRCLKAESVPRYKVHLVMPVNLGINTAAAPRRIEPSRQKRALG